jgi:hypothetical protein
MPKAGEPIEPVTSINDIFLKYNGEIVYNDDTEILSDDQSVEAFNLIAEDPNY